VERDQVLEELKAQLLLAQAWTKKGADLKQRDVQFDIGDLVYMKIRPYRRRLMASCPNEKLAPRFYNLFAMEKKIGQVAYKVAQPATYNIHPVFHVSQLRKANEALQAFTDISSQPSEELEMLVEPEAVLGVRSRTSNSL